jgi:glycosyltransferase involved in cell wall biosynthesis
VKVLLATDAFPPICGGSGWSTYELARGLRDLGHAVDVVQPRAETPPGVRERTYDGFTVREFGAAAPNVPYVRNYFKSERLTRSLARYLLDLLRAGAHDVIHGQHVMTTVAAITAGREAGIQSVATVRDYWPVCYWSDLLHTRDRLELCPECTVGNMARCLVPRAGVLWPVTLPLIPYMRANLDAKQQGLARADAVIAVSHRIADDLKARAPGLDAARVHVIPNPVNVDALRADARDEPRWPSLPGGPYALYLGKLAPNKGTGVLVDVIARADLDWPLVIAGDGPERDAVERDAIASGRDVRFAGWVDKVEAARLLARASMLIFTSRGPESLSRVLIEASALGVPIAAMDTGGTRDIIDAGTTGLLSSSAEGLADDVRRLRAEGGLRNRLGAAAREKIEREFDAPAVVRRIETLYRSLGVGR